MSESDKHVEIFRMGPVFSALDAVRQRNQGVSSYFRLLIERSLESDWFRLSQRFQRQ